MSVLKMAKPPGRCIFCERTGLTKEHVFPDWLNSLYPKRPYNKRERLRAFDPTKQTDQVVLEFARIHQGGPANRKVRVVCSGCNGGWMARLQESAKPVLIPLIQGETCSIEPNAQRLIATWAAVIASTAEYIQPTTPHVIAPHDRDHLWRNLAPPRDWQIWLGYYIGTDKALWYEQFRFALSPKRSLKVLLKVALGINTQVTTMIFGKLYLYVFSSALDGIGSLRLRQHLHPIWPLSGTDISWPLSVGLSDGDRIYLRTRLLTQLKVSSY